MAIRNEEMWLRLATKLSMTQEQLKRLYINVADWDKRLEPGLEAIHQCTIVTARDMGIVVNV